MVFKEDDEYNAEAAAAALYRWEAGLRRPACIALVRLQGVVRLSLGCGSLLALLARAQRVECDCVWVAWWEAARLLPRLRAVPRLMLLIPRDLVSQQLWVPVAAMVAAAQAAAAAARTAATLVMTAAQEAGEAAGGVVLLEDLSRCGDERVVVPRLRVQAAQAVQAALVAAERAAGSTHSVGVGESAGQRLVEPVPPREEVVDVLEWVLRVAGAVEEQGMGEQVQQEQQRDEEGEAQEEEEQGMEVEEEAEEDEETDGWDGKGYMEVEQKMQEEEGEEGGWEEAAYSGVVAAQEAAAVADAAELAAEAAAAGAAQVDGHVGPEQYAEQLLEELRRLVSPPHPLRQQVAEALVGVVRLAVAQQGHSAGGDAWAGAATP